MDIKTLFDNYDPTCHCAQLLTFVSVQMRHGNVKVSNPQHGMWQYEIPFHNFKSREFDSFGTMLDEIIKNTVWTTEDVISGTNIPKHRNN